MVTKDTKYKLPGNGKRNAAATRSVVSRETKYSVNNRETTAKKR
jgi:hypothetical protein